MSSSGETFTWKKPRPLQALPINCLFRLTPPGALFSYVILAKTHKTNFGFGTHENKVSWFPTIVTNHLGCPVISRLFTLYHLTPILIYHLMSRSILFLSIWLML